MDRHQISDTFYYVETKDRADRMVRTVVFKLPNGIYEAFSSYFPDEIENIMGYASSHNDKQAILLAKKDFEKELKIEHKRKAAKHKLISCL